MFDFVAADCDNVYPQSFVVKTVYLRIEIDKTFIPVDCRGGYRLNGVSVRIRGARFDLDETNVARRGFGNNIDLDTHQLFVAAEYFITLIDEITLGETFASYSFAARFHSSSPEIKFLIKVLR